MSLKSSKPSLNPSLLIVFGLLALALTGPIGPDKARADYPKKPVTMVVAYSPGGGTDTAARVVAKFVQPYLGQRLVIQNKPGAGGQIGFTALANARSDGYKIGFINIPSIFMVKMLRENIPYEMTDFEPIANIQMDPVVLAVKSDSPYKTLGDFITAARRAPGKINVGGDGPQSNNQLQMIVAEKKLNIDVNFVSYNGSGPAITSLLGGQVHAAVPSASSATNHIKNGRLRALTVFSSDTYPYLPEVPTVKAASGVDVPGIGASMRGIAAPKGISPQQKAYLEKAFQQVLRDKGFLERAEKMGLPLKYMDADEFSRFLKQAEEETKGYIDLLK